MSTNIDYSGFGDVYLKQTNTSSSIQYSTDNVTWTDVVWPLYIKNSNFATSTLNVKIQSNLNITDVNNIFIINGHKITIDGSNYNVTVTNVTNFSGLIENGTSNENGYNNVTIQNINIGMSNSSYTAGLGWICRSYFGNGTSNNTIQNCTSSADIPNDGGGIVGSNAGANSTSFTVLNCSASGDIWDVQWGSSAGGIIGAQAGSNATLFTVQNCSFSGGIYGNQSGGIVGGSAHKLTITNCSSSGIVKGGGIIGASAGQNYGNGSAGMVTISDCFSTGNIGSNGGSWGGGIVAEFAGNMSITRCYSTGQIGGNGNRYCGGIVGNQAGLNGCSVTISNCFSTGNINSDCGGIATRDFGLNSNKCIITNCYSIGNLVGPRSGGIVAGPLGRNSINGVDIINCFTLGSIGAEGGIIGLSTGSGYGVVNVTNCYVYAATTNNNGVIASGSTLIPIVTNFYSANNNWSDTVANTFLTGINTIWRSVFPNTPYQFGSLAELLAAGNSTAFLLAIGFSVESLLAAGVSVASLLVARASVATLLAAGVSLANLLAAGAPIASLLAAGVSVADLQQPTAVITSITTINTTAFINFSQDITPSLSAITNYAYSTDGTNYTDLSSAQTTSPLQISGLAIGQTYSFRIKAYNGVYSVASNSVSITLSNSTQPTPAITNVSYDSGSTNVYFTQNTNPNSLPITGYSYSIDNGQTYTSTNITSSPLNIPGLKKGITNKIILKAINGLDSEPSIVYNFTYYVKFGKTLQ
jgi:hypothetical protein